eukprot:TRINITY_DN108_c1_g1_i1.p1 TRINITY_DN108_c1_g1~~TRINITY_DN108_c1_g1_i1.p1  ORF type:complete len:118 (+),score=28.79 TRINITY_DN108_c1_g1_i1:45-398(+)
MTHINFLPRRCWTLLLIGLLIFFGVCRAIDDQIVEKEDLNSNTKAENVQEKNYRLTKNDEEEEEEEDDEDEDRIHTTFFGSLVALVLIMCLCCCLAGVFHYYKKNKDSFQIGEYIKY